MKHFLRGNMCWRLVLTSSGFAESAWRRLPPRPKAASAQAALSDSARQDCLLDAGGSGDDAVVLQQAWRHDAERRGYRAATFGRGDQLGRSEKTGSPSEKIDPARPIACGKVSLTKRREADRVRRMRVSTALMSGRALFSTWSDGDFVVAEIWRPSRRRDRTVIQVVGRDFGPIFEAFM
ncbi:hypothetical protein O3W52_28705 [Ensifer psoraleae]|uniref:Uncharacterized protein n=1 Tax=Sinorhizobium psoraleae TaxID=520838 RepID=A0ABT4KPN6_9HYPH|nr:hypothetical protein [Sinorhizobium psoraleae]MCZ4093735.1 hypothetical protein [Sinorhizobium psoraleae]